jgi:hypothetical protein
MRVAVLADIHGNLPALEAVLGYDAHAAATALRAAAAGYPDLDELITENMITTPSDAAALAAFTPS